MALAFPPPPPPQPPTNPNLYAAIDMGTNTFKMLIVRADPFTGKFLAVDRLKERVLLGQSTPAPTNPIQSQPSISPQFQLRAISALQNFTSFLQTHNITRFRYVATSAVREAANQQQFLLQVRENLGIDVEVLSGEEEGKYVYLGILQFLPCFNNLVLCIDIGGGSTELVIGEHGNVKFATSLKLGHVTLTEKFVKIGEISTMREHIRRVIKESGVIEEVKKLGFELVVGSSGTIRAIEKAVCHGYARDFVDRGLFLGEVTKDWRFSKEELHNVVEKLCEEEERFRRDGFFKRRSEFIIAGAVLLEEIFEVLGIEEMEVSGYALGEGVIAERLAMVCEDYDLNANARWRSVVQLATRFNSKKRMGCVAQCACIAKEIFEGLRKCNEFVDNQNKQAVSLDEKDFEYLEAACLLHSVGQFSGKKGYHKRSCHIIMNGDHLHGYSAEEVKLIALLARHHRKKFPNFNHASLKEFPNEVLGQIEDQSPASNELFNEGFEEDLNKEVKHFKTVCQHNLSIVVHSSSSQTSE